MVVGLLIATLALAQAPESGAGEGSDSAAADTVQLSEARLAGIRTYRRTHLRLLPEVSYRAVPQPRDPMDPSGPDLWTANAPREVRSVAVYRGVERLAVPDALELMGRRDDARDLGRQVQRNRRWGATLYTVGIVGAATTLGSVFAMDRSSVGPSEGVSSVAATAGLVAMGVGFVGGTFPSSRARRLQFDPSMTYPIEAFERELDTYNDALRLELGLRPADVVLFEQPPLPVIRDR